MDWRYGVDVSDDVTTANAIRRVNDIVRQKTSLTWKWRIKFFSFVILVGKTLPLKNPFDDTLSSLSN